MESQKIARANILMDMASKASGVRSVARNGMGMTCDDSIEACELCDRIILESLRLAAHELKQ